MDMMCKATSLEVQGVLNSNTSLVVVDLYLAWYKRDAVTQSTLALVTSLEMMH